jgi:hypothetical protein
MACGLNMTLRLRVTIAVSHRPCALGLARGAR